MVSPVPLRSTFALAAALAVISAPSAEASFPSATPFDAAAPHIPGGAPDASASFRRAGWRWPTRRIRYWVGAHANARAIRTAARTWNRSGVRVRFVASSRSRADVFIRYWPQPGCVGGGVTGTSYDASTGRAVRAEVRISRPDPLNVSCSRWAITMVVAHEFGHVLGLAHEPRRCALMNTTLVTLSPARCQPPLEPWRWRCRILERDDVRGAVRIYGGRVRKRGRAICDLFAPPATPAPLSATANGLGALAVSFTRPPSRKPPPHVPAGPETYVAGYRAGTCPTTPGEPGSLTTSGLWTVPAGGVQQLLLEAPPAGRYCIAAWARDGVGRFSPQPATALVDIPQP